MLSRMFTDKDTFAVQVAVGIIFTAILMALAREGFRVGQALALYSVFAR